MGGPTRGYGAPGFLASHPSMVRVSRASPGPLKNHEVGLDMQALIIAHCAAALKVSWPSFAWNVQAGYAGSADAAPKANPQALAGQNEGAANSFRYTTNTNSRGFSSHHFAASALMLTLTCHLCWR